MEIGSEFWLEDQINRNNEIQESRSNRLFFISGRTAIDYVLKLLMKKKQIKTVYFPSYCCQSMMQPFLENEIKIEFYNISFKNGNFIFDIDCSKECDIFFAMNYFGFCQYNMDDYIRKFKMRNIYIIEDSTHSLLSTRKYSVNSDFVVASLRKWFPIMSGGLLIDLANRFLIKEEKEKLKDNFQYVNLRREAMKEKAKYINQNTRKLINKEEFLKKYAEANEILRNDYKEYKMDEESYYILKNTKIEDVIAKRKNNARKIYEYLERQKEIQYLKNINLATDCPIFVPIFLENTKRNMLKQYLIEKQVYCPNHWGIPKDIINGKEIYDMELSLICDQRYNEEDIEQYINLIKHKEI